MYIFRGNEIAQAGTYWDADSNRKVILKADGLLPGSSRDVYFRLPESYLLIPLLLFGLALSVAFPLGIGVALCAGLFLLHYVLFALITDVEAVVGDILAVAAFHYRPTRAFFRGTLKKDKKNKKHTTNKG